MPDITMKNIIKAIVIAPFAIVWLWVVGHLIVEFYLPLFWMVLKGIFTGDFSV